MYVFVGLQLQMRDLSIATPIGGLSVINWKKCKTLKMILTVICGTSFDLLTGQVLLVDFRRRRSCIPVELCDVPGTLLETRVPAWAGWRATHEPKDIEIRNLQRFWLPLCPDLLVGKTHPNTKRAELRKNTGSTTDLERQTGVYFILPALLC